MSEERANEVEGSHDIKFFFLHRDPSTSLRYAQDDIVITGISKKIHQRLCWWIYYLGEPRACSL